MKVNRCEETTDTYKFSYIYNNIENAMCQINKEDIISVSASYDKGKNTMLIVCKLSDDKEACFDIQQNLLKANS